MAKGHSNVRLEGMTAHKRVDAVMIPIEGGSDVYKVRSLPPLALRREEWRQIGDRMRWDLSDPSKNSGTLWVEFHDRTGRIEVDNLTRDGIHAAKFQCTQMLEELEEAMEKLDAAEADEEEYEN